MPYSFNKNTAQMMVYLLIDFLFMGAHLMTVLSFINILQPLAVIKGILLNDMTHLTHIQTWFC